MIPTLKCSDDENDIVVRDEAGNPLFAVVNVELRQRVVAAYNGHNELMQTLRDAQAILQDEFNLADEPIMQDIQQTLSKVGV